MDAAGTAAVDGYGMVAAADGCCGGGGRMPRRRPGHVVVMQEKVDQWMRCRRWRKFTSLFVADMMQEPDFIYFSSLSLVLLFFVLAMVLAGEFRTFLLLFLDWRCSCSKCNIFLRQMQFIFFFAFTPPK